MSALTRNDLSVIEGDARISDRRLSEALGFVRIGNLHRLIKQRQDELREFGGLFLFEEKKSTRGRAALTYMLNEHQAVALAMWAETPQARDARRQIIEVFVAARRGDAYALAQQRQAPDRFADHARRVGQVADSVASLGGMVDPVRQLTHLPIWSNGRRPPWWHNIPLRQHLTETHRQMTMQEALDAAKSKFGTADLPSMSALNRYWMRLDEVFGPAKRLAGAPAQYLTKEPL